GKDPREILWSGGRSEIARRGWPGVDAPGLVIEGEAFTIEMSRIMKLGDGEEVAYGYRLIAEAELAPSTVNDMHIACQASKYVCAYILSDCGGDVQEALRLLPEVRGKWEELESLSEKRQQSLGLRSGGCFVATQATALEDSWLLGARLDLGAAALSFAARETLRPMPNECFSDQDYQEALGHERPNVLPVSTSLYRNTLSFRCGQEYTAEIWASPDFRLALDRKGLIIEAGVGGHEVPFAFHPVEGGKGSLSWREETWIEVAMTDLLSHLRKHRRRHEVVEALLSTPEKDPSLRNQPEPWHRTVAGSWFAEAKWYGTSSEMSQVLLAMVTSEKSAFFLEFELLLSGVLVAYRLHEYDRGTFREAVWTSDRRRSLFGADPENSFELFPVPKALEDTPSPFWICFQGRSF
ncbi:unnamed protein product, partial [Symbiodinium necroappetens]